MSKYPQNTMHVKIMYGLTDRRHRGHRGHRTFAPVDLTAPKVAAGKKQRICTALLGMHFHSHSQIHPISRGNKPHISSLRFYVEQLAEPNTETRQACDP